MTLHLTEGGLIDLVTNEFPGEEEILREKRGSKSTGGPEITPEELAADEAVTLPGHLQEEVMRRVAGRAKFARPGEKHATAYKLGMLLGGVMRKLTNHRPAAIADAVVDGLRDASTEMDDEDAAHRTVMDGLRNGAAKPLLIGPFLDWLNLGPPMPRRFIPPPPDQDDQKEQRGEKKEESDEFLDLFELNSEYYSVPPGTLRPEFEKTINLLAKRDGVSPDGLTLAYMIAVSGLVDKKARFRPYIAYKLADNLSAADLFELMESGEWAVPPILWFLVVARSGDRKTALWQLAFRVTAKIKARLSRAFGEALREHMAKPAKERGAALDPPNPVMMEDATLQAMEDALALADGRLVMKLDEAATWLASFGRWNSGAVLAERGGWNGFYEGGPLNISRVGRKAYADCNGLAVFGLIQPQAIAKLKNTDEQDGLLQRMQVLATPEQPRGDPRMLVTGLKPLEDALAALWDLPAMTYRCTLEGAEIIRALELEAQEWARMPGASMGFQLACAKLHGSLARIAFILHLMEAPKDPVISTGCIARADRLLRDCLLPSMYVFFENINKQPSELVQRVATYLLTQTKDHITPTMIKRHVHATAGDDFDMVKMNALMDQICMAGYADRQSPYPGNNRWTLRPGVREKQVDLMKALHQRNVKAIELLAKLRPAKSTK